MLRCFMQHTKQYATSNFNLLCTNYVLKYVLKNLYAYDPDYHKTDEIH